MINVELNGDAVTVNMNGTAYHLPKREPLGDIAHVLL